MLITITDHAKFRCEQREITESTVRKIVKSPERLYLDSKSNHFIAIRREKYYQETMPIAVSFDNTEKGIKIVSVFPEGENEIQNRLERKRYVEVQKNPLRS